VLLVVFRLVLFPPYFLSKILGLLILFKMFALLRVGLINLDIFYIDRRVHGVVYKSFVAIIEESALRGIYQLEEFEDLIN
jgi:hypothetical protein